MHIPTKESVKIDILTFEEARTKKSGCASYDENKWLYIPGFYSEYRYILGTVGRKPLITIGINPSTAAPDALDSTLKSVERIAGANGFDSFIMFNIYAQRATQPKDMDRTFNKRLHTENMKAFRWVLEKARYRPTVWAGWGTFIDERSYLKNCLKDMIIIGNEYNAKWVRAGDISKKGHPHHPLYLKKDSKLIDLDVKGYLANLQ